jgi:chromosome segregation ATPase
MAELERCQRLELELRRQLKDRERLVDDLQQETEKRVGQIQLEVVNLNSTRQQLEREVGGLRLDLDGSRQELRSEKGRHETEVDSLRGRLKRTEEQLVTIDFQCLHCRSHFIVRAIFFYFFIFFSE